MASESSWILERRYCLVLLVDCHQIRLFLVLGCGIWLTLALVAAFRVCLREDPVDQILPVVATVKMLDAVEQY